MQSIKIKHEMNRARVPRDKHRFRCDGNPPQRRKKKRMRWNANIWAAAGPTLLSSVYENDHKNSPRTLNIKRCILQQQKMERLGW